MNKFKEWIRTVARQGRVDLVRKPMALLKRPDAQLNFDVEYVIAHALLAHDHITIVQVGANDGQTDDPINALLRLKRCRGILLEPNPESFQRLQESYKNNPQVTLVNAAISETDGKATLYSIRKDAPGPAWVHGLSSFDKKHLLNHDGYVPEIHRYIKEFEVECLTFDTLFRRFPVKSIDVLQIDTEGFDAEVLRLFNVPLRKPSIINFEHRHLPEAKWDECVTNLINEDYKIAIVSQDTLAYRVPAHLNGNGA